MNVESPLQIPMTPPNLMHIPMALFWTVILGTIHKRRRHFFQIFDTLLHHVGSFLVLSVGHFDQFLTPPPLKIADVIYGWPPVSDEWTICNLDQLTLVSKGKFAIQSKAWKKLNKPHVSVIRGTYDFHKLQYIMIAPVHDFSFLFFSLHLLFSSPFAKIQ